MNSLLYKIQKNPMIGGALGFLAGAATTATARIAAGIAHTSGYIQEDQIPSTARKITSCISLIINQLPQNVQLGFSIPVCLFSSSYAAIERNPNIQNVLNFKTIKSTILGVGVVAAVNASLECVKAISIHTGMEVSFHAEKYGLII